MRYTLAFLVLFSYACGGTWEITSATTPEETLVLAETARLSGALGQQVHGEISPTLYMVKCLDGSDGCHASGWYVGGYGKGAKGVAYYYKTDVNKSGFMDLTSVAAHEVCHSLTGPEHDQELWDCMAYALTK